MGDRLPNILNLTTWSGAAIAGFGAWTVTEWMAVGGFLLASLGFAVNLWHKIQMVRLERRKFEFEKSKAR